MPAGLGLTIVEHANIFRVPRRTLPTRVPYCVSEFSTTRNPNWEVVDVNLNCFLLEWTWKDSLLVEKKAVDDKFFQAGVMSESVSRHSLPVLTWMERIAADGTPSAKRAAT